MLCEWNDIFDIVERQVNGRRRFVPRFKHSGVLLNELRGSETRERAEGVAFNWCNAAKNQKEILELITELALLIEEVEASTGLEPVLTD